MKSSPTLVYLESVGTFVDTDTGMTYPAIIAMANHNDVQNDYSDSDGDDTNPDTWEMAVYIEDTTEEWMDSMSSEDIETLEKEGLL
jgi:hypothetical protein